VRIDRFSTGLIGDLAGDVIAVDITRVGEARYLLRIHAAKDHEIELWTTRKDRILVSADGDPPGWARLVLGSDGELVSFSATECHLHFEHLDRNLYCLGVVRGNESWGFHLRAHGYVKTRVLEDV
jgi:hypothetical protein